MTPPAPSEGELGPVALGNIARRRRMARFEAWVQELHEHRELHQQSRFRWWGEDVLSVVTWTTRGQLSFTRLRDLTVLAEGRRELDAYTFTCELNGLAPPLLEAQTLVRGANRMDWSIVAPAVHLDEVRCRLVTGMFQLAAPADREPTKQNKRILRMAYSNPLIRVWETQQLVAMHKAAIDIFDDTMVDLVEELRPTHRLSDIMRAAHIPNEDRLNDLVTRQRDTHGEPGDPRRQPHQTYP